MSDHSETSSLNSFSYRRTNKQKAVANVTKKQVIQISGSVTALKVSPDGNYLGATTQEGSFYIFIAFNNNNQTAFRPTPLHTFHSTAGACLDVAWSRNNFAATASVDKTVRLYHVKYFACLAAFIHNDIVTCLKFHPFDDRFIITGCLDSRVRVWAIHEKKVLYWNELPNKAYITAIGTFADCSMVIVGTFGGDAVFYEFEDLKYHTQISMSTKAASLKQRKITGIESVPARGSDDEKLLISCNDGLVYLTRGKIRVFNTRDKSLFCVYRGCDMKGSSLRASIDDEGKYILCGGLDRVVNLWTVESKTGMVVNVLSNMSRMAISADAANRPVTEKFTAIEDQTITAAIFAPYVLREVLYSREQLLPPSGDLDGTFVLVGDSAGRIHIYEYSSAPPPTTPLSKEPSLLGVPNVRLRKSNSFSSRSSTVRKSSSMSLDKGSIRNTSTGASPVLGNATPSSPDLRANDFRPRTAKVRVASEPLQEREETSEM